MNKLYKVGAPEKNRSDLVAVLLTGIPKLNFISAKPTWGRAPPERRRCPLRQAGKVNNFGVVAGDNAGWPNGRRLNDDVVNVAERAVAGFLLKGHKVSLGDGVNPEGRGRAAGPLPVRRPPALGLREREGHPLRRATPQGACSGGPPELPAHTDYDNPLSHASHSPPPSS